MLIKSRGDRELDLSNGVCFTVVLNTSHVLENIAPGHNVPVILNRLIESTCIICIYYMNICIDAIFFVMRKNPWKMLPAS